MERELGLSTNSMSMGLDMTEVIFTISNNFFIKDDMPLDS